MVCMGPIGEGACLVGLEQPRSTLHAVTRAHAHAPMCIV